jgi:hypothetical protein
MSAESPLPVLVAPGLSGKISKHLCTLPAQSSKRLRLLVVSAIKSEKNKKPDCQLPLPLACPRRTNVVRFAARRRIPYLDFGVYDTFQHIAGAKAAALKLESREIFVIGQLVQMTEEQVRSLAFVDDEALRLMKEELAAMGLGFGCRVPSWTRRYQAFLAIAP